jgi:hypothetical protein
MRVALLGLLTAALLGVIPTAAQADNSGPAVASWGSGRLDFFARGPRCDLVHRYWDANYGWSAWETLGGCLAANSKVTAISRTSSNIDVFVRGADNGLWQKSYNTSGWTDWINLGGLLTSGPDVASRHSDGVDVFARSGNGDAVVKSWTATAGWTNWSSVGGGLAPNTAPTATSRVPGQLDLYVVGTDSGLYQKSFTDATGWTPDWYGHGGILTSGAATASWGSNSEHVFARSANAGDVVNKGWSSPAGWTAWTSMQGAAMDGAEPDVTSRAYDSLDLVIHGTNNDIYLKTWQNSTAGWGAWNDLGQPDSSPTSTAYGGADSSVNTDAEAQVLLNALNANGGANSTALLNGLTPADSAWIKNNYLMPGTTTYFSPSGPAEPASAATDPSEASNAATDVPCQKEQNFKVQVPRKGSTYPIMELRWDMKYCWSTNSTLHHVKTIFQAPSGWLGWKPVGSMSVGGGWDGGHYEYRRILQQQFENCGGSNIGVNTAAAGIQVGANGCLTLTFKMDRTVYFGRLWHTNYDDSANIKGVRDVSSPVGTCSGGTCGQPRRDS